MSDAKPSPDEAFKLFTRHVGRVLREREFIGSGSNYRRARGSQWQAINIQKSQWRCKGDPVCFYVNIGIDYPGMRFKRWTQLPTTLAKFSATKADTTFRIDDLFPRERFGWFACGQGVDGHNLDRFSARFERVLTDQLVPLLDEMATPEGLARVLRMLPWMVSAGARAFVGKDLAPPEWDPADLDAGKWKQDKQGRWWRQGER